MVIAVRENSSETVLFFSVVRKSEVLRKTLSCFNSKVFKVKSTNYLQINVLITYVSFGWLDVAEIIIYTIEVYYSNVIFTITSDVCVCVLCIHTKC